MVNSIFECCNKKLREYVPLKQGLRQERFCCLFNLRPLREYVPLKQGLRPPSLGPTTLFAISPRVCSTKTRIKTLNFWIDHDLNHSPRVCSTKTRIKTIICYPLNTSDHLREYVPLKQGLRLVLLYEDVEHAAPRVCSTKTRIKTTARPLIRRGS